MTLQEKADQAISAWREATSAHELAAKGLPHPAKTGSSLEETVRLTVARIKFYEVENTLAHAKANATRAVDAVEVAAGDALATSRDARTMHADISALDDEIERLGQELEAARRRRMDRVSISMRSSTELSVRRAEQNLPPPTPLPSYLANEAAYRDALQQVAMNGVEAKLRDPNVLSKLRRLEVETRASIERQREEQKEREAVRGKNRASEQSEREARQRALNKEWEKKTKAYAAEDLEMKRLADAHRTREASSS